jgi:hypothetical protein
VYEKPKVERFGTFRELTRTSNFCPPGDRLGTGFGSIEDCPDRGT